MIIKSRFSAEILLHARHVGRVEEVLADYQDEAAEAALDGDPRRAFYVEHMSSRVAEITMRPPSREGRSR